MKRRTILILLGVVITILTASLTAFFVINSNENKNEEKPTEVVELDSIPDFGYALEDRDTELYKATFEKLREVLTADTIDYAEYAKLLAELYIIDLYTLDNKMNQYDAGSLDFVLESARESFELKVKDTLYKYIEDNSYGKRTQILPIVSSIGANDAVQKEIKVGETTYDGYTVAVTWNYETDLGYDTEAEISLVKIENKLYVTNQSASE